MILDSNCYELQGHHSFLHHSIYKYLLTVCHVSDPVLGLENRAVGEIGIVHNFKEFIISKEHMYVTNYKQVIVLQKIRASFLKLSSQNTKCPLVIFGKNTQLELQLFPKILSLQL